MGGSGGTALRVTGGINGIQAQTEEMTALAGLFGQVGRDTGDEAAWLTGVLTDPQLVPGCVADPVGWGAAEAAVAGAAVELAGLALRCAEVDLHLRAAAAAYAAADALLSTTVLITLAGLGPITASALDDGHPHVTVGGRWTQPAPRSLTDLVAGLVSRNAGPPGAIDVRFVLGLDGRRRVIVDVPGTKNWSPAARNPDITSLVTNLRAIDGKTTSYEEGVLDAMRTAGVRPEDEVLMIGHSEGGMVALNAATHTVGLGEFDITRVITLGAPIGRLVPHVPRGVQVLAVENTADRVPSLDGRDNTGRRNVVTARIALGAGTGGSHDLRLAYLPGAADLQASTDPSLRAYLDDLAGFLNGGAGDVHTFVITREYR